MPRNSLVRELFTGSPGARSSLVRVTRLAAPALAPPAPAWQGAAPTPRALLGIERIAARIREMDAPVVTCSAPSCPRGRMPHGALCVVCASGQGVDTAAELEAAGWAPVMSGKIRRGWRDPVTGDVLSARTALSLVRRDDLKARGAR